MRWIVVSLIVINILALAGQLLMPRDDSTPAVRPPSTAPELAGTKPLRLLSELDPAELRAMSERDRIRPEPSQSLEATQPLCTLVGPFPELLPAEYFVERLAALEVASAVQDVEIPGEVSYWVYLPPLDSRRQAFNRLRELQAKGIDSYVIPKGDLENGISFGMFSQADLAQRRLEDMRSQGYPAEQQEITRSYKETWVVLPPGQAGRLGPETWQQMLADGRGLERRQNFCPPVASE